MITAGLYKHKDFDKIEYLITISDGDSMESFEINDPDEIKQLANQLLEICDQLKGVSKTPMPEYSVFNLAVQAENLRNGQKAYFMLIAKAKKSKLPADYAEAAKALKISQAIEKSFDETVAEILGTGKEVTS